MSSELYVEDPTLIKHLINGLFIRQSPLIVNWGDNYSFLTTILGADFHANFVWLDKPNNEELLSSFMTSNRIYFKGSVYHAAAAFHSTPKMQGDLLGIEVPSRISNTQRRQFVRFSIPSSHSIYCEIPFSGATSSVQVLDISAGGLGIIFTHDSSISFEQGSILRQSVLSFKNKKVRTNLKVLGSRKVYAHDGTISLKTGCMFDNLPSKDSDFIQKFIFDLERLEIHKLKKL